MTETVETLGEKGKQGNIDWKMLLLRKEDARVSRKQRTRKLEGACFCTGSGVCHHVRILAGYLLRR